MSALGRYSTQKKDLVIDVDGKITVNGVTSSPFSSEISHAAMCDKELLPLGDLELRLRNGIVINRRPIENGMSKANLGLIETQLWS